MRKHLAPARICALAIIAATAGCRDRDSAPITVETRCGRATMAPVYEQFGPGEPTLECRLENGGRSVRVTLVCDTGSGWREIALQRVSGQPGDATWRGSLPNPGRGITADYYIRLHDAETVCTVPTGAPQEAFRLTFKGKPSRPVLIAHVLFMMGGIVPMIVALIAGLVSFRRRSVFSAVRRFAFVGFICLAIGALPLGIIVERQVFGTYWEGWPFGRDVTDTKTGLLLVLWLAVILVRGRDILSRAPARRRPSDRAWTWAVMALVVFTLALYLIPHENMKF